MKKSLFIFTSPQLILDIDINILSSSLFSCLLPSNQLYKTNGRNYRIHLQVWDTSGQERFVLDTSKRYRSNSVSICFRFVVHLHFVFTLFFICQPFHLQYTLIKKIQSLFLNLRIHIEHSNGCYHGEISFDTFTMIFTISYKLTFSSPAGVRYAIRSVCAVSTTLKLDEKKKKRTIKL